MRARTRMRARIGASGVRGQATPVEALGHVGAAVAARASVRVDLPPATLGRRLTGAGAGALFGAMSVPSGRALVGVVAGAWAGTKVSAALDARAVRAREAATTAELPHVLERMGTALRTGVSIDTALRIVAPGARGPLGDALRDAVRAADLGVSRADALARAGAAPGEPTRRAIAALIRSDRLGTPAADVVETLANDVRARARAAVEADARTAPIRMLFPLVFCFLPAFVLLTIAPIAVEALRTLGGI